MLKNFRDCAMRVTAFITHTEWLVLIRTSRTLWFVIILVATSATIGCGGGGGTSGGGNPTPPAISSLTFSPNAAEQSANGTAAVNGTVNFTDSGGDLSTLTITIFDPNGAQVAVDTAPIQGVGGQTSGTLAGSFQVSTNSIGLFSFRLSVTDSGGSKSNELTGTFQVYADSNLAAVVATTGPSPASLTVVNGNLYWSETEEAALKSIPISGGSATVLATKVVDPRSMAFVGSDVIWLDDEPVGGIGVCGTATINRVLKRTSANGTTSILAEDTNCAPFTGSDVVLDGSTVFWISSTLSSNTYVIHATPLNGGPSNIITTTLTPVVALADRAGTLYWMESFFPSGGTIRSVPVIGGTITTLVNNLVSDAGTFAVDDTNLYYTTPNFPYTAPPTEMLIAAPLAGGPPTTLSSSISRTTKMAVGGGQVLWIDASSVNSVPVGGGASTVLAATPNTPLDLLVSGSNVLWGESSATAQGETGALESVALTGGPMTTLYQGDAAIRHIAMDLSSQVNWIESGPVGVIDGSGRIARLTASNAVQTVVSGLASNSATFVATSTDLFIADMSRIKRLPLSGGMPITVAADNGPIADLATDGTSVYWDNSLDGSVRKAPAAGGIVTVLVSASTLGTLAGPGGPIRLAPNGNLYWAVNSAEVLSAPAATTSTFVNVVAQGLPSLSGLAVDASNVYLSEPTTGNIIRVPNGGGATTILANAGFPLASISLALDGSTLYWIDPNRIMKVPTAGGAMIEVVGLNPGSNPTASIAVDTTNAYWTEPTALDIRKSSK